MLDVARKFFTMDYLKQYVKILSFYKMNEFQIHLNDNGFPQFFGDDWNRTYAAFRLESERFPGLTAKDGSYSKQEFIDLQRMGLEYGVRIIPEIDIPAHSLAFAHYKPEIASRKYGMDHLDLYKKKLINSSTACWTNICRATIPYLSETCTSVPTNTTRKKPNNTATSQTVI